MGRMLKGASAIHGVSLYLQVPKLKLPVLERNSTLITGVLSALFPGHAPRCSLQSSGPECSIPGSGRM